MSKLPAIVMGPYDAETFFVRFAGPTDAVVIADAEGTAGLYLSVFGPDGKLVESSGVISQNLRVRWKVPAEGLYRVHLFNKIVKGTHPQVTVQSNGIIQLPTMAAWGGCDSLRLREITVEMAFPAKELAVVEARVTNWTNIHLQVHTLEGEKIAQVGGHGRCNSISWIPETDAKVLVTIRSNPTYLSQCGIRTTGHAAKPAERFLLEPMQARNFFIAFRINQKPSVQITSDRKGSGELLLYDSSGKLIAKDAPAGDILKAEAADPVTKDSSLYRLRIANLGNQNDGYTNLKLPEGAILVTVPIKKTKEVKLKPKESVGYSMEFPNVHTAFVHAQSVNGADLNLQVNSTQRKNGRDIVISDDKSLAQDAFASWFVEGDLKRGAVVILRNHSDKEANCVIYSNGTVQ